MRVSHRLWSAAALLVLLFLAACGSTGNTGTGTSAPSTDGSASDLEALYWARQDSARMAFTEADVHFMTGMIAHHAQALVMSRLAPAQGASPQVQTLAARIINAQQDEIETMQRWLRERGQPVPEIDIEGTRLVVHGAGDHVMHMPGMLTQEQIQELAEARGRQFDRLFLSYMIQHHEGAVVMVDNLLDSDGAAQDRTAFRLASDIHTDQTTEIARMKQMLDSLTGGNAEDS